MLSTLEAQSKVPKNQGWDTIQEIASSVCAGITFLQMVGHVELEVSLILVNSPEGRDGNEDGSEKAKLC